MIIDSRLQIPVFNSPFSNSRSVAELIMAEVVALARRIGDYDIEMHKADKAVLDKV